MDPMPNVAVTAPTRSSEPRSRSRHGTVYAYCLSPCRPRRKGSRQQREGAGRSDRRTAPLDEARYEQRRDIRSKTARHGRESEDHKAQTEQSQSSVKVAGAPACKEEPSKGQCVEARHPIEVGGRDVKRPLHARQGHIDDGVVKHQHQLRRRDDKQC
jgi:hypothetical protein